MRLPIVDCRSLIQFCRAFDQHHKNKNKNKKQPTSTSYDAINNKKPNRICDTSSSPFAALDILILILVLTSLGYLISPYINIIYNQLLLHILPQLFVLICDVVYDAPIAYVIGAVSAFSGVIVTIVVYEFFEAKSRKCGRKDCKGLRKAVAFDIQLESEECVKYELLRSKRWLNFDVVPLELGKGGYKEELEAELRKMAPVNGRTVLIFREKCGCPKGRLEVWGAKRVRRIKK